MISIIKQPSLYTPVDSPVQFQLSSTTTNVLYFNVQVLNAVTSNVIANQKFQTLPNYNGTAFDLSSILSSYVDYQVVTSSDLIKPTPNIYQSYKLNITDYKVLSGGTIESGSTLTTDTYNVWNAELDRVKFNGYNYLNYVLNSGTTKNQFLSNKQLISNLYNANNFSITLLY